MCNVSNSRGQIGSVERNNAVILVSKKKYPWGGGVKICGRDLAITGMGSCSVFIFAARFFLTERKRVPRRPARHNP
jgi:hypothetical protein